MQVVHSKSYKMKDGTVRKVKAFRHTLYPKKQDLVAWTYQAPYPQNLPEYLQKHDFESPLESFQAEAVEEVDA